MVAQGYVIQFPSGIVNLTVKKKRAALDEALRKALAKAKPPVPKFASIPEEPPPAAPAAEPPKAEPPKAAARVSLSSSDEEHTKPQTSKAPTSKG